MPRPWPWCPLRPCRVQRSIISRNSPRRPLTGTITYSLIWFSPSSCDRSSSITIYRYVQMRVSFPCRVRQPCLQSWAGGSGLPGGAMRGSMARLAGITLALVALSAAPASARVLQPAALPRVVAGSAYVRVNQVGYSTSAAKRAYLMSSVSEAGATFSVMAGTTTVFTAPIGSQLGSWSATFPHVYALDFPTTAAGTYTIAVSGPVAARSPSFAIGAGSSVYAGAIGNALSFYQDERDG